MPGPGGLPGPGGCLLPGGAWSLWGVCSWGCVYCWGVPGPGVPDPRGVSGPGGAGGDPPGRPLLRVVRILLECILVSGAFTSLTILDPRGFFSVFEVTSYNYSQRKRD